jgi:hypothetical protein
MKRVLVIVLILALTLTGLSACAGANPSNPSGGGCSSCG